jgi:hypothetical protein
MSMIWVPPSSTVPFATRGRQPVRRKCKHGAPGRDRNLTHSARHADLAKLINPAQTRFDLAKLNWLGSLASETGVVVPRWVLWRKMYDDNWGRWNNPIEYPNKP